MVYYTNDSITRALEKVLHELQVARASIFDSYKAQEHVGGERFCHAGDGARTGGGLPRLNITPSFAKEAYEAVAYSQFVGGPVSRVVSARDDRQLTLLQLQSA